MSFGATPVDGSSTPVPMSSVVPDGTNAPVVLEGGPSLSTGGNTLAPASMYVKDGNNLVEGATTDAAVTGDVAGSLSAKLRGLSKLFNAVIGVIGSAVPGSATQVGGSDGANLRSISVTQAHNADNQTPLASGYGILANTNAGVLNAAGTVDRARGTGSDGVPAVGIPAGAQQLAGSALTTTFNGSVTGSANAQSVVVVSTANMKVGDIVATQDNPEFVEITVVTDATHCTGIFKNNHASGQSLTWYHYNQARDATIGDALANLAGLSPSATYLWNNVNSTMEYDRSANGEKDGASGQGTAVAAEYEWNGNPLANGNVLSGLQFDRARNLNAKGLGAGSINNNPLAANSTTLTLNSAPTTLDKGFFILIDRAGANPELNYVGTGYTPGSTSVPLQIATQFSHAQNATVEWDQNAPLGPGLNGFLAAGIGIEEEALWDPVSLKYFIERSATQDNVSPQNVVMESVALINGAGNADRQRGNIDNLTVMNVSAVTTTQTSADQTNYNMHGLYVIVNVTTLTGTSPTLTPLLQGKSPVAGGYFGLGAALTAINTTGKYVYFFSLNAPAAAGGVTASVAFPVPRTWNFVMTAGGTITNATYTVEASYIA